MASNVSRGVQSSILAALALATETGSPQVNPVHVIASLMTTPGSSLSTHLADLTREEVLELLQVILPPSEGPASSPALSQEVALVLNESARNARDLGHAQITEPTLTAALLALRDEQVDLLVESLMVEAELTDYINENGVDEASLLAAAPAGESTVPRKLQDFVTDLTAAPPQDPIVSRADITERLATVLARRSKGNPVLVGEPGVGKSAIVEELAQAIHAERAPADLNEFSIWQVDMGSLISGTRTRGDFEERIKLLTASLEDRKVFLFIDELHAVVDAGSGSEGQSSSAQDLLKPALSRGNVRLIGATTSDEYAKYVEKDAAFARRFTRIDVPEPSPELAVQMLSSWVSQLSEHHQVSYSDDAVQAAVDLTHKWVSDRFLPDKALDVLDEAGSVQTLARARGQEVHEVTKEAIARVVSDMTKIPLTSVDESTATGLLGLRDLLADRVIGQTEAVDTVSRAVLRRRVGVSDTSRPASFLFVGPTGVGKTELAKALADVTLGDDVSADLIVIDCSELDSAASVAKLIGAPPGYVGHDESSELVQRVRRNKNAVVLFDEADKAHPVVFDTLLQILEEGRLTDGAGRTVDFSATTVILTSNHGSSHQASPGFVPDESDRIMSAVKEAFRPEFLNRLDAVVSFKPLTQEHAVVITMNEVSKVVDLALAAGVTVSIDESVYPLIAEKGFDPVFGARSLRRTVLTMLTNPLADHIIAGETEVHVTVENNALTITPVLVQEPELVV